MSIRERITAVFVLQRFVRLSRVLLPMYMDLSSKKSLSLSEENKLAGIKQVYDNFQANPQASNYLINSNILSLIQKVYEYLVLQKPQNPESFHNYNEFIKESDRLIELWDRQLLN
ncbi:hypothetical protein K6119_00830 [Paracrocinitomix mangrovi]|uniref:hypothetical protein n=1 Tax=Paracrocinitomix mangrovi TaxID=2862509 RepID=UPI001C8E09C7|nr:hypothetical protein [Paracrocinitomix mangrovi]UKN02058.1 hypothetical protein K6119_00830 [Paracrocinitomix mangrovi]